MECEQVAHLVVGEGRLEHQGPHIGLEHRQFIELLHVGHVAQQIDDLVCGLRRGHGTDAQNQFAQRSGFIIAGFLGLWRRACGICANAGTDACGCGGSSSTLSTAHQIADAAHQRHGGGGFGRLAFLMAGEQFT